VLSGKLGLRLGCMRGVHSQAIHPIGCIGHWAVLNNIHTPPGKA